MDICQAFVEARSKVFVIAASKVLVEAILATDRKVFFVYESIVAEFVQLSSAESTVTWS